MQQAWNLLYTEISLVLGKEESLDLLKKVSETVFEKNH